MMLTSRLGLALVATVGPLVAGCFGPHIESGAFACEPQDDPPCPSGFFCFHERCVTNAASLPGDLGSDAGMSQDLAAGGGDLATGGGDLATSGGGDLAHAPPDLAMPRDLTVPPDLTPPPDLATGMCGHAGAPCTTIADCCSMYCRTDGICIGG
jgi:hypothetical protein